MFQQETHTATCRFVSPVHQRDGGEQVYLIGFGCRHGIGQLRETRHGIALKRGSAASRRRFVYVVHYKYIPRTGGGFTQADAEYVCLNPKAAKLPDDVKKYPADQLTYMGGQVRWHIPTWEDMPTQYHVAQALGSLPVKRIVGAVRSEGYTLGDLYGQTTVM